MACGLFGFVDERVQKGEAYGFVVGENFEATLDRAEAMKRSGEIFEIELGAGSSAEAYAPDRHAPSPDQKLQLIVDSEVWNDSIYLTFADGALVEIWRFRSPVELP